MQLMRSSARVSKLPASRFGFTTSSFRPFPASFRSPASPPATDRSPFQRATS